MKLIIKLVLVLSFIYPKLFASPQINNISYGQSGAKYEKYEVSFSVNTVSSNYYWPYDIAPAANVSEHPNAIPTAVGISVDGLFLPPGESDWGNAIIQPAFFMQDYETKILNNQSKWIYPVGDSGWKIRFSPSLIGPWKFKIKATDSEGTTYSSEYIFVCMDSKSKGFVRVSINDSRYFETSNGEYLNFIGGGGNDYVNMGKNGVNLIRPWWNGSQGPVLFGISGQGGMPNWGGSIGLDYFNVLPKHSFSFTATPNNVAFTSVFVKPSTSYKYSIWIKSKSLASNGSIDLSAFDCLSFVNNETFPVGDFGWTRFTATIATRPNQYSIDFLKIGITGGQGILYFSDVSVQEDYGNGKLGPNLISKPSADVQTYISQYEAYLADTQVEDCKTNNIYLKICLEEKADSVFSRIQPDGTIGTGDDNNFYAQETHASRTYQKYFWRYIIARYGYSTAIHSFEYCNEGDPYNGNHYKATNAFAAYFKQNDPNRHLCTTSFWHSIPTGEFWENSIYPDIGYIDWHAYVNTKETYGWFSDVATGNYYLSSPNSGYQKSNGDGNMLGELRIPVLPNHKYTASAWFKGKDLTKIGSSAGSSSWIFPTLAMSFKTTWSGGAYYGAVAPGKEGDFLGTYDWTKIIVTGTAPANTKYIVISPGTHWAVGELWIDNITLHDDTNNIYIELPNGNFDSEYLNYDTALLTYSNYNHFSNGASRSVTKPVIRGEVGITDVKKYGVPYKGLDFTGENQSLVDDTQGIWYKKFTWAQINPTGVIEIYWWQDTIRKYNLMYYAKAYQNFMFGIPLSNGNYKDIQATTTTSALRVLGQMDVINNKAHLWIDNAKYTWKAVVDHNYEPEMWNATATYAKDSTCGNGSPVHIYKSLQNNNKDHPTTNTTYWQDTGVFTKANNPALPAPVSGSFSFIGFTNGVYNVEWWDTSTGTIVQTNTTQCINGKTTVIINNLISDVACKIYVAPAVVILNISVPSGNVNTGDIVTVTVNYSNTGNSDAINAVVSAKVPNGMEYVAGSAEQSGGVYNPGNSTITWIIDKIGANESGFRTFTARVK